MTRDLQRWDDDGGRPEQIVFPAARSQVGSAPDRRRMAHEPLIVAAELHS